MPAPIPAVPEPNLNQILRANQCDEKKPCTSCQRHHVQCSLVQTSGDAERAAQQLHRRVGAPPSTIDSSTPRSESVTSGVDDAATSTDDAWITDLELLHHYTTVTYTTIPSPRHTEHVLRDDIPRLGIRFPYLMHQLLAVASLHIAYLSPETSKRYLVCASYHQSIAISGIRTTLAKPIAEGTSQALFAASAFLMVGTFATNRGLEQLETDHTYCPMDGILETFSVVRGVAAILEASSKNLQRNLVVDLFGAQPLRTACESLRVVEDQLSSLKAQILVDGGLEEGSKLALCSGVDLLLAFMGKKSTVMARKELSVVFGWPWNVSEDFLQFLRARHPAALTIFLYYCIIMHSLEADYWFLDGWSARLGRVIATSLRDSQWEEAAQAPLQQLKVPGM